VVRVATGAAVLGVLVWRVGGGPFRTGLRAIDAWSLVAASALTALTTVCCAWRWHLVARGLGIEVALPAAVAAYYRSQFLNSALPGGVLGDVHRGIRHGRQSHDLSRGLRAVAWERSAGQVVQLALTAVILLVLPSPVHSTMPAIFGVTIGAVLLLAVVLRALPAGGPARWVRIRRTVVADVRAGIAARAAAPGIVVASVGVVVGHVAVFVVAARAVGSSESLVRLIPLALLVLLATSLPTNIGGWGPREGAAAWVFAAAGLGAHLGVAVATAYGVLAFVATAPGAVVLIAGRSHERRPTLPVIAVAPNAARELEDATHG
jgi:uncharacterized membrane protein YbhN (UPF0104 family)